MSSAITDFKAALSGGGARSNRFEVIIDFPSYAGTPDTARKSPYLVSSSQSPGCTLGTIEQPFRGRVLKLPGDRTFDTFETVFVNDTDFDLHDAFERWHNQMNMYNANTQGVNISDLLSDVTVYQLGTRDQRLKEYVLKLAWPSIIGPIELAQDANNQIQTFSVSWEYSDIDNGNGT